MRARIEERSFTPLFQPPNEHDEACAGYVAAVSCESRTKARQSSSGLLSRIC
jgi:hypothetical protein